MARYLVLVAFLVLTGPAGAQDPPVAEPGGVATLIATFEVAPSAAVTYTLRPGAGVRVFAPTSDTVRADGAGVVRLPFTFGVPATAGGGLLSLARLELEHEDGTPIESRKLRVRVRTRRAVELVLRADTATTGPGEPLRIAYRLDNRGNVADTFHLSVQVPGGWSQRVTPGRAALEAGDTLTGIVEVTPPRDAPGGGLRMILAKVEGTAVDDRATAAVVISEEDSWLGELSRIPGSVFIGSSSDASTPGVALSAAGSIGSGTKVSLDLRPFDRQGHSAAFSSALSGPRLRIAAEGRDWGVQVGDVLSTGSVFTGATLTGQGGSARVRRGSFSADVLAASPRAYGNVSEDGHLVRAGAAVDRSFGRVGLALSDTERRVELLGSYGLSSAALTYELRAGGHSIEAKTGIVQVRSDSASRTGLAGSFRYGARWTGGSLTARGQLTPATTSLTASQPSELFVSGNQSLLPGLSLTGWGFATTAPTVTGGVRSRRRGATAGFRFQLPAGASGQLLGKTRRYDGVDETLPATSRRSVHAGLNLPLGAIRLETEVGLGEVSSDSTRPFRSVRLGSGWTGAGANLWAGLIHYDDGLTRPLTAGDVSGSLAVGSIRVRGGLNLALAAEPRPVAAWGAVALPFRSAYELSAGLDYRATRAEPWRVSLGVTREIGLPLPIRRAPVVEGVVFEDLDGDRRRDPREPALPGVSLRLGALRTTTDEDGRYRFLDDGRGPLRVAPGALPAGTIVPRDAYLAATGTVDIPVIRTAQLRLRIFLDRDGDAVRDPLEPVASDAGISLVDVHGRTRAAAADEDGQVRFGALPAGEYRLLVYPAGSDGPDEEPFETSLTLEPGGTHDQAVAVPLRRREIRVRGGDPLDLQLEERR